MANRGSGHPYAFSNEARNLMALVLLASLFTALVIPPRLPVLLLLAKGLRSRIILYVILGMILWYLQFVAVSFEFC